MRTLITGAGMVGSQVAAHLVRAGDPPPVLYDLAFSRRNLEEVVDLEQVILVQGDVTEPAELFAAADAHEVTRIIHTAGLLTSAVNARFAAGVRVNLMGTVAVLEVARLLGMERVVFCSSGSAVIGKPLPSDRHVPENVELDCVAHHPPNPYSTMKLAGEWLCRNYEDAFGFRTVSVRPAGVYAPWFGTPNGQPATLVRKVAEGALSGRVQLTAADAAAGMDFVHAADVAQALTRACAHADPPGHVYYAANGVTYSVPELVDIARAVVDREIEVEIVGGDTVMSYDPAPPLDISRARAELGYEPEYSMEAGVRQYIEWGERTGLGVEQGPARGRLTTGG